MATGQQGQKPDCESPNGSRHSTMCGGDSAQQHVCASNLFQTDDQQEDSHFSSTWLQGLSLQTPKGEHSVS